MTTNLSVSILTILGLKGAKILKLLKIKQHDTEKKMRHPTLLKTCRMFMYVYVFLFGCIFLTIPKCSKNKNNKTWNLQCFPLGNRTCFRFHDRVTTATSTINNAAAMETNSDTAAAKVASTKRKEETQRKYLALEVVFFWLVVEPTHLKKYESNWIISPGRGEIKKYLQPPPSFLRRRLWSYRRPLGINRS